MSTKWSNIKDVLIKLSPDLIILTVSGISALYAYSYIRKSYFGPGSNEALNKGNLMIQKLQNRIENIQLNEYERIIAADIISPEEIEVSFEDIGGLEDVKRELEESVLLQMTHPEFFQRGLLGSQPKGVLLFGPPGTGKTLLAKAIAKTTESAFISLNAASIFQKWLGESEKLVAAIFSLAHKIEPCIIFLDEIDSWLGKRNETEHEVSGRVKAIFMQLWDGISSNPRSRITVIGATNKPYNLDEAILRRMPLSFHIGLPSARQREQILGIILKNESLDSDVDITSLANELDGYSGSDLHALCLYAARQPLKDWIAINKEYKNSTDSEEIPLRPINISDFKTAKTLVKKTGQAATDYQQIESQTSLLPQPETNDNRPIVVNFNLVPNFNTMS